MSKNTNKNICRKSLISPKMCVNVDPESCRLWFCSRKRSLTSVSKAALMTLLYILTSFLWTFCVTSGWRICRALPFFTLKCLTSKSHIILLSYKCGTWTPRRFISAAKGGWSDFRWDYLPLRPCIDLTPSLHHSSSPSCCLYVSLLLFFHFLFPLPVWTSLSFSSPSCPVIPPPSCGCRV